MMLQVEKPTQATFKEKITQLIPEPEFEKIHTYLEKTQFFEPFLKPTTSTYTFFLIQAICYITKSLLLEPKVLTTIKESLEQIIRPTLEDITKEDEPEVIELANKLKNKEELSEYDKWLLKELCKASGWEEKDIKEDLMNIDKDPMSRLERYWNLFREYYERSKEEMDKGEYLQAAEKMWGAVVALVKYYAARRRIPIKEWDHETIWHVIENNFPRNIKDKFRKLLEEAERLHKDFYENERPESMVRKTYEEVDRKITEILDLIKKS